MQLVKASDHDGVAAEIGPQLRDVRPSCFRAECKPHGGAKQERVRPYVNLYAVFRIIAFAFELSPNRGCRARSRSTA